MAKTDLFCQRGGRGSMPPKKATANDLTRKYLRGNEHKIEVVSGELGLNTDSLDVTL